MLSSLLTKLFDSGPVYVGVHRKELLVRNAKTGRVLRLPAAISTDAAGVSITAVGREAVMRGGGSVHWPFNHPRMVVDSFQLAQKLLQEAFRQLFGSSLLRPSPVVVMHSLEDWEGGLTQIEWRVLHELAHGAGARKVYLWQGNPPSDSSLCSGEFMRSSQLVKS